ncbi:MAG: phosphate binding protein [Rickettsiales bacterium]|nr:phosphate binding protein [Rickettsiales bacterium]
MFKKFLYSTALVISVAAASQPAQARDQVRAVGSSTVYPFVTIAAEDFGRTGTFSAPIVEATGTGGGFKLFCTGVGDAFPDIVNASRPIKESEVALCKQNGVKDIAEFKIGFDGIVLANAKSAPKYKLTKQELFLALAGQVPVKDKLVANPFKFWSDVSPSLPKVEIQVYGPPPTSGTRDAFAEMVLEAACMEHPVYVKAFADSEIRKKACHVIREDGKYIESGENDNLIVQKLNTNPNALGIFGYSFLEENASTVQGNPINGIEPTLDSISSGTYTISRPLFVYVKKANVKTVKGLREFVQHLLNDKMIGEEGSLSFHGLVPLPADDLKAAQSRAKELQ